MASLRKKKKQLPAVIAARAVIKKGKVQMWGGDAGSDLPVVIAPDDLEMTPIYFHGGPLDGVVQHHLLPRLPAMWMMEREDSTEELTNYEKSLAMRYRRAYLKMGRIDYLYVR